VDQADDFGRGVAALGDLDGDGIGDIAVGASRDDDGGADRGAAWILFLNRDGSVRAHQKISDTEGAFSGILDDGDAFGWAVGGLGDVDGDGIADMSVGAPYDDDGGTDRGALWILLLRANGRVKAQQKISATKGEFAGELDDDDLFGLATAGLGDLGGDDRIAVAAGAPQDDDFGHDRGACWILTLEATGMVAVHRKISAASGVGSPLQPWDYFGSSIAVLDDLDGDGFRDLAVGAIRDDDGGTSSEAEVGAVWILGLGDTTTTTELATTTSTLPTPLCGDANGDGTIAATDALIVLRTAVGTATCEPCVCDADASGAITAADALRLLRAGVGEPVVRDCPPCG
ncbi:MAG TPA: dockerin type I domain-containing protein, partial [Candidatus Binatia bacterium]|nr:dockerin type I domain-containing protein [Candidatus Binatia bacterium]